MSIALFVLTSAALVIAAWSASAVVGGAMALLRAPIGRLEPGARVHLLTAAAFAPMVLGILAVGVALAPSFGSAADHCGIHEDHHPHLCVAHAHLHDGLGLVLLAVLAGARVAAGVAGALAGGLESLRVVRSLSALSSDRGEVRTVDMPGAFAATLGWWRPRAFVSTGVPAGIRAVVVAHERAHVRHRDPVMRAAVQIGRALHLPGVARAIGRALHRAQEARADGEAAREIGDRTAVAEALVEMARLCRSHPLPGATAFTGDVEARVAELLDDRSAVRLGRAPMIAVAIAIAAGLGLGADHVHHALESALGLFGG
jgi:hypothetical protein